MSDIEEPAAKVTKFETPSQSQESIEDMDEGQEEWLSEDILTDDDYNPAELNKSEQLPSDDETYASSDEPEPPAHKENIEMALDKMDNGREASVAQTKAEADLPDELGAFLIRKTEGQALEKRESDIEESKHSDDDGHDTDELLRMLGEDGSEKVQKVQKVKLSKKIEKRDIKSAQVNRVRDSQSTDDEEGYILQDRQTMSLRSTLKTLSKKPPPTKAEPEDMSDKEDTEVDNKTVKPLRSMQRTSAKKLPVKVALEKNTPKEDNELSSRVSRFKISNEVKRPTKKSISDDHSDRDSDMSSRITRLKVINDTPGKKIARKAEPEDFSEEESEMSSDEAVTVKRMFGVKSRVPNSPQHTPKHTPKGSKLTGNQRVLKSVEKREIAKRVEKETQPKEELDETLDDDEFLDEDDFDLDEDMESEDEKHKQDIMRPEEMDEEVPSDEDSQSEDDSLYDELPSSDSEDLDDWFTLDIRAEKAADYLPMLGNCAHSLLSEEKVRVSRRVASLRNSMRALSESSQAQHAQLSRATLALSQLDALLKAA